MACNLSDLNLETFIHGSVWYNDWQICAYVTVQSSTQNSLKAFMYAHIQHIQPYWILQSKSQGKYTIRITYPLYNLLNINGADVQNVTWI